MKQIENVKMFMVDVNWIAKNVKLIKELLPCVLSSFTDNVNL